MRIHSDSLLLSFCSSLYSSFTALLGSPLAASHADLSAVGTAQGVPSYSIICLIFRGVEVRSGLKR